jgi:transcriptional regulator GlxA family with amidase domain
MRSSALAPLLAAFALTLAKPQRPLFSNTTTLPTHFGLLVFPHFQALDVFGPIDVLNNLNMMYNTTADLTILAKTLDPVTTGMTGSHFAERIVPTMTFDDYLNKDSSYSYGDAKRSDIEVLIVPGGGGTRNNVSAEIDFVKTMYPKVRWLVSICTGATIVARAGVLDGRNATTNKFSWTWATSTGPNVNWIPTARWVEDGNIFSSSGVSAGIDATYGWVSRVFGEDAAQYLADAAEYNREKDPHVDPFGKLWEVPGAT